MNHLLDTAQIIPSTPLKLKSFIGVPPTSLAPPLFPNDHFLLGPSARSVSTAHRPLTPTAPSISPPAFTTSNNLHGSQPQTAREKEEIKNAVQKEFDNKIYELTNDPLQLELGDGLANTLGPEAEDILVEGFLNKKELED